MRSKFGFYILFVVFAGTLFLYMGLQDYLFIRPQSIHQWRQTVSLNITLNFAEQDNGFLQPETNLLNADDNQTGIAQGEFPVFYYVMGKIWKLVGQQEWLYRVTVLAIFLSALYCIALFLYEQTKQKIASIVIPLFFFATPVLAYYSVSFLMDIVGFSLVVIGWFGFYRYVTNRNQKWLAFFFFAFLFAGLLKVTALISVIALAIYCLAVWLKIAKSDFEGNIWFKKTFWAIALVAILNLVWYSFAIRYNQLHNAWYTENGIYPIWQLTAEKWLFIKDWVISYWHYQYAPQMSYVLLFLVFVYLLFSRRTQTKSGLFTWVASLTILGSLIYVALWFQVFDAHDYYVIVLYVVPIIFVVFAWIKLSNRLTKIGNGFATICLLGLLVFAGFFTKGQVWYRLNGWPNNDGNNKFSSYFDIEPYLRNQLKIARTDKVVAFPDESVCISLYLADQKGWQLASYGSINELKNFIGYGAKYLLVNDSAFYNLEGAAELELLKIGQHKNVTIFSLPQVQDPKK